MTQQVLQMGIDRWLDAGVSFMNKVNYLLGRLYLEISENNTKSKEYFQAQIRSDRTLRTRDYIVLEIKRSKIRPPIVEVWGHEEGGKR